MGLANDIMNANTNTAHGIKAIYEQKTSSFLSENMRFSAIRVLKYRAAKKKHSIMLNIIANPGMSPILFPMSTS
jgi:hypothetical protein